MRRVKGIKYKDLQRLERENVMRIVQEFYGRQFDLVESQRIEVAIRNLEFPESFYNAWDVNAKIAESALKDEMANIIRTVGIGRGKLTGMLTAINEAVGVNIAFKLDSNQITKYITENSAKLAVNLTKNQHAKIKEILLDSAKNNFTENQTQQALKTAVTLTDREILWANNHYLEKFDFYFERYSQDGLKDPEKRAIDAATRDYSQKVKFYQDTRARRIAETELKRAHGFAEIESHRQAIEGKIIKMAWKVWRKNNYSDNWPSSDQFNGMKVRYNESFGEVSGKTTMLTTQYPSEINERCSLDFYIDN